MNKRDRAAVEHLRGADPVLRELIDSLDSEAVMRFRRARIADDHYGALVRSIVGQQLSTKAARAIYARLTDRFGGRTPTPVEVLEDDPDGLRTAAGLSHAKVRYLRSLAEHVVDGSVELEKLDRLPDVEVISELTAVTGIGEWSSHMFLMFHLGRPDVLAVGDLGIRKAVQLRYGLDALPDAPTLERIAAPWSPYRTLSCLFLWQSLDAVPA
ncbi:MAG: DNA-3-methyladenine glycosylase 2 family protein [Collimonas pratensis]|uniref:DNA-3-methyladenine glycosylase family protein n=1 Tax=Collimonas pratensis TaxID=279113 RepID=UPI003C76DBFF